ncbi:MAG: Crp/Fnr family transcriptional regulator [Firmicutes bacterium]|nr:Crp/Fnr family transcriptional regulator [Bacillota bacterium]
MINLENQKLVEKHLTFWNKLEDKQKNILLNNIAEKNFIKGDSIHSADEECLGVLLIKSGVLRVFILSEDGREVTLYRLYPGNTCILSASCILNSMSFEVHISADEDTQVLLINIAAFGKVTKENVYAENFSLRNAMERFSEVMYAVEEVLFSSIEKRLANFLLEESDRIGENKIKVTHDQIAKNIGSAREVVTRMLKVFHEEGLIEQGRGRIKILNEKGLEKYL